ncbi:MAG TPA: O-antigen ligase family protein [Chitinophagaceae bacterium]|nr:O-antigen ligase family protein [Chitinophagaceae bacterium]
MKTFFLLIEVLSYAFALFILLKKKDLAIMYLPVLIFSNNLIVPVFSASLYYGVISGLLLSCIWSNATFYKNNVFAILLFIYFLFLLPRSGDLTLIRHDVFSMLWLFLSIPLIAALYQKYTSTVIFRELTTAALIILILFIANTAMATKTGYAPYAMYGITKGVLFGNLYGAGFNILASALFITVLKLVNNRKVIVFIISLLCFTFIMLTLRRSVMLVGAVGVIIAFLTLVTQKEAKNFIVLCSLCAVAGYLIYTNTGFKNEFEERYEMRKLDDRSMAEEKRFIEYELLYKDMFVEERYSPWFGYQLFNSAGNYGNGVFENRTLHSDITSILHSSGLIGLLLYVLMVATAFRQSFRAAANFTDKFIILFGAIAFIVFTTTGRVTETGSVTLIFLISILPLTVYETESSEEPALSLVHST